MTLAGALTVDGTLSTTGASVAAGSVAVNAGAALSGSGTVTGTITDNGTITASGGLLTLSGTVGGTGPLQIDVGATLDVNSTSAGETISFLDGTGTLIDHQIGTIGAAISGFVAGDTIDLSSLTFAPGAAATIAGGVLTVTSGATSETLNLIGISNATIFSVAADASSIGTDIAIGAAPQPPVSTPPVVAPPPLSSTPPGAIAAFDTTSNQPLGVVGQVYTGPVVGLENEFINITSDSLNIGVTTDNWFIHSGAGTDAIAVHGGTNVLDGGTGSNFLTGGSGTDTFFVDDRGLHSRHLEHGRWTSTPAILPRSGASRRRTSPSNFVDGQGAGGFTGLTLHATAAGKPTASLTLAGFTQADMTSGRLSVQFGTDQASGSAFMFIHANS